MAKKTSWMKIPEKIFFICKNFGTGVLIATAFVHVSTRDSTPRDRNIPNSSSSYPPHS